MLTTVPIIDLQTAAERARTNDLDGAIELARHVIADQFEPEQRSIAAQRQAFSSNHCFAGAARPTWTRPKLPSAHWQLSRPTKALCTTNRPC